MENRDFSDYTEYKVYNPKNELNKEQQSFFSIFSPISYRVKPEGKILFHHWNKKVEADYALYPLKQLISEKEAAEILKLQKEIRTIEELTFKEVKVGILLVATSLCFVSIEKKMLERSGYSYRFQPTETRNESDIVLLIERIKNRLETTNNQKKLKEIKMKTMFSNSIDPVYIDKLLDQVLKSEFAYLRKQEERLNKMQKEVFSDLEQRIIEKERQGIKI